MKIRHIYTVVRENNIKPSQLRKERENLLHMQDEKGEFLYDFAGEETIEVKLQVKCSDGEWKDVE